MDTFLSQINKNISSASSSTWKPSPAKGDETIFYFFFSQILEDDRYFLITVEEELRKQQNF